MFGILKGLTKAAVTIASAPGAIVADVVTAGGSLVGKEKMFTEDVIDKLEEAIDNIDEDM